MAGKSGAKGGKKSNTRWVVTIIIWTFVLSVMMQLFSSGVMPVVSSAVAVVILFSIILLGVVFDIIGVAVTAANETPFHSMAARRVKGAREAIALIRNAEKVANFCNDVVGDIAGIVSGAAAAIIVTKLAQGLGGDSIWLSLIVTGLVAGLTVGGKAVGKAIAIGSANSIVYRVALIAYWFKKLLRRGAVG